MNLCRYCHILQVQSCSNLLFNLSQGSSRAVRRRHTYGSRVYICGCLYHPVLRRAPALETRTLQTEEYANDPTADFNTALHPRLHSLNSEHDADDFLRASNVPSRRMDA